MLKSYVVEVTKTVVLKQTLYVEAHSRASARAKAEDRAADNGDSQSGTLTTVQTKVMAG